MTKPKFITDAARDEIIASVPRAFREADPAHKANLAVVSISRLSPASGDVVTAVIPVLADDPEQFTASLEAMLYRAEKEGSFDD